MMNLPMLDPEWIEQTYLQWQQEPESVSPEWQAFFKGFELGHRPSGPATGGRFHQEAATQHLIQRYRELGHTQAHIDPLSDPPAPSQSFSLEQFGFSADDLDTQFSPHGYQPAPSSLGDIQQRLQQTYCGHIGVEFMHILDPEERKWLGQRMEVCFNRTDFSADQQAVILSKLQQAAMFEQFLHKKFLGQKRFSLEGGEAVIPMLDQLVVRAAEHGVKDVVLGMAHRGRLNVLANIFGKPLANIFAEFGDNLQFRFVGEGDVKYHKGFSADRQISGQEIHMSLASNPSHLEVVGPVVEGKCRSRQDSYNDLSGRSVLPVQIHGDAAFAGQGVVAETLNLSQLEGYRTGGTVHIVLNNQIGFTTHPRDARSTRYATDVAKMLDIPIFHIHGEQPEAAVHAALLALEYRQTFGKDVVLDLICFRRHGHNEGDEPSFTQPQMYRKIAERPSVHVVYADQLKASGFPAERIEASEQAVAQSLEEALAQESTPNIDAGFQDRWKGMQLEWVDEQVDTGIPVKGLKTLAKKLRQWPDGFAPHPKVSKMMDRRLAAVESGEGLDWGTAESLAYASLVTEGIPVRLSGQDSRRGTFNQRHSTLFDFNSGEPYVPLSDLAQDQARFQVWDSHLSEAAVLGFEYGYSVDSPRGLTIWEAQFGDFANGAQVLIDQFIVASESKWQRMSGLTLFLPHGYEGQGAEHSSARPERYLQLCSHNNIQVVNPTTPAQIFHLLRRQVKRSFRRPLVVMTPKSLLRHPVCVSPLADLTQGMFKEVIADTTVDPADVKTVLLCSGKLYYELDGYRRDNKRNDVAIIRIEQLYPIPAHGMVEALKDFNEETRFVWVQEEIENGGAWSYIRTKLTRLFGGEPRYVSRPPSPVPAGGSHRLHVLEQQEIIEAAFNG